MIPFEIFYFFQVLKESFASLSTKINETFEEQLLYLYIVKYMTVTETLKQNKVCHYIELYFQN